MAALQKVRNAGPFVVGALFLGLLGFIATDWAKVVEIFTNADRNTAGIVNGNDISVTDFNKLVDEYTDVVKATQGLSNISDEQMQNLRDQVWNNYVQNQLIAEEADKLGLTVTDAELQNIISTGANPMLQQTPFVNQQGQFDTNALKGFLAEYDKAKSEGDSQVLEQYQTIFNWWKFVEKTVRQQTLVQKYQALLANCIMSNKVLAEKSYNERQTKAEALVAAVPFSSIKDNDIEVSDNELKAKYDEMKEVFVSDQEMREIKYIDIAVKASKEDEKALNAEMDDYAAQLKAGAESAKLVRESQSMVSYCVMPVSAKALPRDVAGKVEEMAEGDVTGPYFTPGDNTMNIIRLNSIAYTPDSVEYRTIGCPGADMAAAEATADSIITAINAGTPFDSIAAKYGQNGQKQWLASAQYDGSVIDDNNKKFLTTLTTSPAGSLKKVVLDGQGVLVVNVLDTKNVIKKYDVAVIKRSIDFSKDTYNKTFNDFSSFLAGKNAADIEAEAQKAGYTVNTLPSIVSSAHNVAGIASTRDALRWIFNSNTKVGDVSPLYECGNNDHLLCITLSAVHKKGYLPWDDAQVKEYLTELVKNDKKAAKIQEQMANAKSVNDVMKIAGAVSDTLRNVSFSQGVFVAKTGAMENTLSASISTQAKGAFKAGVKGNVAVYAYQVLNTEKNKDAKFDVKAEKAQLVQMSLRYMGNYTHDLYKKAEVVDNRYLFY